jgi:hypothetical protein
MLAARQISISPATNVSAGMRWVVGDRAIAGSAASASQMGRFETKWLSWPESLAALADLPGQWIEKVQQRRLAENHRARHGFEPEPDLCRNRSNACSSLSSKTSRTDNERASAVSRKCWGIAVSGCVDPEPG